KRRRQSRVLRMAFPQRGERFQRSIATADPQVESSEIPLGEGAPRLGRIPGPSIQLSSGRFAFRAIKLVQFRENPRKIDIGGAVLDKILERVVPGLRRVLL